VHGFLKDQYEAHLEQFDTLGEFIRSMDYLLALVSNTLPAIRAPICSRCTTRTWKIWA
jgi:hypothetical protein